MTENPPEPGEVEDTSLGLAEELNSVPEGDAAGLDEDDDDTDEGDLEDDTDDEEIDDSVEDDPGSDDDTEETDA